MMKKIMCVFIRIASWGDSYDTHNIFFNGKVKKIICYYQLSVALESKQILNGLAHVSSQDAPHKVEKYTCWLRWNNFFLYSPRKKKN